MIQKSEFDLGYDLRLFAMLFFGRYGLGGKMKDKKVNKEEISPKIRISIRDSWRFDFLKCSKFGLERVRRRF